MTSYAFDNRTLARRVPWLVGLSVQEMGRDALVERLTATPVMFETS